MIITLIGYRGTGKSSVAPALAQELGMVWCDADRELERNAGCRIRDIFETSGESEFRRLERETLIELLQQPNLVIAAGGGAILNPQTRADFRAAGPVVWLKAELPTIMRRLQQDSRTPDQRPSLTTLPFEQEVSALLLQREPLYRETASMEVATDVKTIPEIVSEILGQLKRGQCHSGPVSMGERP